jgi:hypothetical protein
MRNPILQKQIPKPKKSEGLAQVVEHVPQIYKAPGSITSSGKKKSIRVVCLPNVLGQVGGRLVFLNLLLRGKTAFEGKHAGA